MAGSVEPCEFEAAIPYFLMQKIGHISLLLCIACIRVWSSLNPLVDSLFIQFFDKIYIRSLTIRNLNQCQVKKVHAALDGHSFEG